MQQDIEFVPYDASFLPLSRAWLGDPEIKALTMTPDFSQQAQADWFAGLPERRDYLIWGVRFAGQPVGACGLKGIADGAGEYWGYIGEKSCWGRGVGTGMVGFVEARAREAGLQRLWLRVWERNARARGLYERLGFHLGRREGAAVILTKTLL